LFCDFYFVDSQAWKKEGNAKYNYQRINDIIQMLIDIRTILYFPCHGGLAVYASDGFVGVEAHQNLCKYRCAGIARGEKVWIRDILHNSRSFRNGV
jgi:hypothetical protein